MSLLRLSPMLLYYTRRGFPGWNSPPDCSISPPALWQKKDFASCGTRRGLCPSTPPPFVKGGRKLLCRFCLKRFRNKLIHGQAAAACPCYLVCCLFWKAAFLYSSRAASLSIYTTTSWWNWRIDAGQTGVTSPLIIAAMASALAAPVAIITIFFAFIMEPTPMVNA